MFPQLFPFSTRTHTHRRFRIFSRSAGINIYSPVDGALPHRGILRAKDGGDRRGPVCWSAMLVRYTWVHIHTHTHTHTKRYLADDALHLFHARWFAIGRCMPSNPDRRRLRSTLIRKGPNTLSNGKEKRFQYSFCTEYTGRLTSGCLLWE